MSETLTLLDVEDKDFFVFPLAPVRESADRRMVRDGLVTLAIAPNVDLPHQHVVGRIDYDARAQRVVSRHGVDAELAQTMMTGFEGQIDDVLRDYPSTLRTKELLGFHL